MGMKLILLGAPGAGKGTQAEVLCQKLGIPTISTGNILRAAIQEGTPVGLQAKSFMDAGKLVPDEVIIQIVAQRIVQSDCAGGLYPGWGAPHPSLRPSLDAAGVRFDRVLSLEITDQEIEERMSGRRVCSKCGASFHIHARPTKVEGVCDNCGGPVVQRDDDKPETVRHRLEVYHQQTEPLKDYYQAKGLLTLVDNRPTIEATTQAIMEALQS